MFWTPSRAYGQKGVTWLGWFLFFPVWWSIGVSCTECWTSNGSVGFLLQRPSHIIWPWCSRLCRKFPGQKKWVSSVHAASSATFIVVSHVAWSRARTHVCKGSFFPFLILMINRFASRKFFFCDSKCFLFTVVC